MPGRKVSALVLGAGLLVPLSWLAQSAGSASTPQADASSTATCSLRDLSVTVAAGSAVSNQEAMLMTFLDKAHSTCSLPGYPNVVATRPGLSATAKDRLSIYNGGWTGTELPHVVLHHGQSASVVIGGASTAVHGVTTACYHQRYRTIHVSIPGATGSLHFSALLPEEGLYLPSCAGVWVTPFAPGVGWFLPSSG
jgi:Domain of unknown function (DUF4232)